MKQRTIAAIGISITAILMVILAYTVYMYNNNPDSTIGLMTMAMVSTGLMTFLIIFGLIYTKPQSNAERYMEMYGEEKNKERKN